MLSKKLKKFFIMMTSLILFYCNGNFEHFCKRYLTFHLTLKLHERFHWAFRNESYRMKYSLLMSLNLWPDICASCCLFRQNINLLIICADRRMESLIHYFSMRFLLISVFFFFCKWSTPIAINQSIIKRFAPIVN